VAKDEILRIFIRNSTFWGIESMFITRKPDSKNSSIAN
jgi:hypothetical protein